MQTPVQWDDEQTDSDVIYHSASLLENARKRQVVYLEQKKNIKQEQ